MIKHLPQLSEDSARCAIRRVAGLGESQVLAQLIDAAALPPSVENAAWKRAHALVGVIRKEQTNQGGVDALLHEFSLSSEEGIVLMCLAEALLRIPDKATVDRMIQDRLGGADWASHLGQSDSLFVNASAWGLLLTGKVTTLNASEYQPASLLGKTLARLGEPVVRSAMRYAMKILGAQFVLGRDIESALERAKEAESSGFTYSYDMLGEAARTTADAAQYHQAYLEAIEKIGAASASRAPAQKASISVKLSALHPRYEYAQFESVKTELVSSVKTLVMAAKQHAIGFTLDAEESSRLDISLEVIEQIFTDPDLADWHGFGLAVQAYQKPALEVINWADALARRVGRRLAVRLVKGAYWDSEIKWAQEQGYPGYPVFTSKAATDVSYQACAKRLLQAREHLYPQFATHNAYTVATILALEKTTRAGDDQGSPMSMPMEFEFQRLHGMGEELYHQLVGKDGQSDGRRDSHNGSYHDSRNRCRIYAPVGEHADLLAYLVRRMLENGANTSFVNNLQNRDLPLAELLSNPVKEVALKEAALKEATLTGDRQAPSLPLPEAIYHPHRVNSAGMDLADGTALHALNTRLADWWSGAKASGTNSSGTKASGRLSSEALSSEALSSEALSSEALSPGTMSSDTQTHQPGSWRITNPANREEVIGMLSYDDRPAMHSKLAVVLAGQQAWRDTPVAERAACLLRIATALETVPEEFLGLCMKEAGKTLEDSIAEVREAVDFCRYYSREASQETSQETSHEAFQEASHETSQEASHSTEPLGTVLCISPWNFPVAIFLGQVSAALVTGNTVLAKPAEQTSLLAQRLVALMYRCGIPTSALQLLVSDGKSAGDLLVPDPRINGVMFTGGCQTAHRIARMLRERDADVPLIAETGGLNAMIVDSTALTEQVVDDVIVSAFHSAGQRCSALRLLYLQEDVADDIIEKIIGRMETLVVGDPASLATDVGPIIDEPARERLQAHCDWLASTDAQLLYECSLDTSNNNNSNNNNNSDESLDSGSYFAPRLYALSGSSPGGTEDAPTDSTRPPITEEVFGPILHLARFAAADIGTVIAQINATGYGLTLGVHSRIEGRANKIAEQALVGNIYINRNMVGAAVGVQPFGGRGKSGTGPKAGGPHYLKRLLRAPQGTHQVTHQVTHDAGLLPATAPESHARAAGLPFVSAQQAGYKPAGGMHEAIWRCTPLVERVAATRCWLSSLVERVAATRCWLSSLVAANVGLNAEQVLASVERMIDCMTTQVGPHSLASPTGETNHLQWEARGVLGLLLDESVDINQATQGLAACILAGNGVQLCSLLINEAASEGTSEGSSESTSEVTTEPNLATTLLRQIAQHESLVALVTPTQQINLGVLNGMLMGAASKHFHAIRRRALEDNAALIPILRGMTDPDTPLRLMVEKTITVNTTAAGGNASLMNQGVPS